MRVTTSRFGTIDIEEKQVIRMPEGMIGFPDFRNYVLLEHKKESPFWWWQCLDAPSLAFVLTDPLLFKPDYEVQISPEDEEILQVKEAAGNLKTLVVVNISRDTPPIITANLLGPLVINVAKRLARQIIQFQNSYSHRFPLPLRL
ncbi:MAG: flagellar assembly protein FliW [Thermodesulfobacteriota bacterium]